MARVRWEYCEVIRTVIIDTGEFDSAIAPQSIIRVRSTAFPTMQLGRAGLARVAAPALAMAALALSRGIAERRNRLAMRDTGALPVGRAPVIALPAKRDATRAEIDVPDLT